MLFDTHAHVTAPEFDVDRQAVLDRAEAAGVAQLLLIGAGYGLDHNEAALNLAATRPGLRAAVGIHPHDATLWSAASEAFIAALLDHPRAIAVGECGLDYARGGRDSRDAQLAAFAAQCRIARARGLPVVVHTRDAVDDTLAILAEHGIGRDVPGVIHFFTGDLAAAERFLAHGLMLGIPGVVTLPNAPQLRAAVPHLPLDRLLIETDCPYAAPVPRRGRRNEPAWVVHVAEAIAALQGRDFAAVAAATTANAQRTFRWPVAATP